MLEVVETDLRIDAVPVEELVVNEGRFHDSAVNVLLVQNVEHRLEQLYQ